MKHNDDPHIINPTEKAELLHKTLANPIPPKLQKHNKLFQKKIIKKIHNINVNKTQYKFDEILNADIQTYEILNCINDLSKDKACRLDQIYDQMIMNGGPTLYNHLTLLFNKCLKEGMFPNIWNCANVHPINKLGKFHSNPKNYRPIAVSSCLGRIFEKVLAKRLQQFCVKN